MKGAGEAKTEEQSVCFFLFCFFLVCFLVEIDILICIFIYYFSFGYLYLIFSISLLVFLWGDTTGVRGSYREMGGIGAHDLKFPMNQ